MIIKHTTPTRHNFTIELERDGSYSVFSLSAGYVRGGFKSVGEAACYANKRTEA